MRRIILQFHFFCFIALGGTILEAGLVSRAEQDRTVIKELRLISTIEKENVLHDLRFDVHVVSNEKRIRLLSGPVAYILSEIDGKHRLDQVDDGYFLSFERPGDYSVQIQNSGLRPISVF